MSSLFDRVDKARRLKVELVGEADDGLLFTVKGNDEYTVLLRGNGVSCNCKDYQYRSLSAEGYSYLCKHIWACLMHMAQRGGGW